MVQQVCTASQSLNLSACRDPGNRAIDLPHINYVLLCMASLLIASLFER